MQQATICYCIADGAVLLGMKKTGFGTGKWNGFGGKVDPGESNEEAAARELFEEAGLATDHATLEKIADISFYFGSKPKFQCHAYIARAWDGEPQESNEMSPRWFALDALPYEKMWISDTYWLSRALAGERLRGTCRFNETGDAVDEFTLESARFTGA